MKKQNRRSFVDMFNEDELDGLLDFAFPPVNSRTLSPKGDKSDNTLITFIIAAMQNMGWSREDLAENMGVEVSTVNEVLDGLLPEAEIDDKLLAELAYAIGYEPEVLAIMLKYDQKPTLDEISERMAKLAFDGISYSNQDKEFIDRNLREIETLQRQLANLLVQSVSGYQDAASESLDKQQVLYEGIVKSIQSVVTVYQADIDDTKKTLNKIRQDFQQGIQDIQSMLDSLKAAQAFKEIMDRADASHTVELKDCTIQFVEKDRSLL